MDRESQKNLVLYHFSVVRKNIKFIERYQKGFETIYEALTNDDMEAAHEEMRLFSEFLLGRATKKDIQSRLFPFLVEIPHFGIGKAAEHLLSAKRALDEYQKSEIDDSGK